MLQVFLKYRINIDVYKFKPIWNPQVAPIKFIIHIKTPPKIELKTSLIIHFIGTINILPKTNNIHIQDINIRAFIFILSPQNK